MEIQRRTDQTEVSTEGTEMAGNRQESHRNLGEQWRRAKNVRHVTYFLFPPFSIETIYFSFPPFSIEIIKTFVVSLFHCFLLPFSSFLQQLGWQCHHVLRQHPFPLVAEPLSSSSHHTSAGCRLLLIINCDRISLSIRGSWSANFV